MKMDMNEYKLNDNINTCGTCLYSEVKLKPIELILAFGKSEHTDNYKVSGEYFFEHIESGTPITLYDWKYTTLYESDGVKPSDFWKLDEEVIFHIGSNNSYCFGFDDWIKQEIKNRLDKMNGEENE
jgi:hypothetical protein